MTIELGVTPLSPTDIHYDGRPSDIGSWSDAADLQLGWMVRLGDGRWCEVVGEPVLVRLGRVSVEVSWQGGPSEQALFGFGRLVRIRTQVEEREYIDALEKQLEGNGS